MDNIQVVKINVDDIAQLQSIGKQTFFETFADKNSLENMQKYLEEGFTINKLTTELTNPDSEFYFAKLQHSVIGFLKINFGEAQTELHNSKSMEIERIYVLKEFQGMRVGQILFDKAIDMALQAKVDFIWLGVWEENPKAIKFYQKNGFVEFDKHIFKLGDDEQTDIMMKLSMNNYALPEKDNL
jgi:ribosomal protein S18 acetylase RimI-like enzyme